MKVLRIFIADDQTLMRDGLQIIINNEEDMEVIGTASNGQEALEKIKELQPDIALLDIKMPIMDGIECTRLLKNELPDLIVLILTTFNEEKYIIDGLAYGANGFLLKGIDFKNLITTIRNAAKGQIMLPSEVASKLALNLQKAYFEKVENSAEIMILRLKEKVKDLTDREMKMIELIVEGLSNREIAQNLYISEGTTKNYISELYRKLGVKNRNEAIEFIKKCD